MNLTLELPSIMYKSLEVAEVAKESFAVKRIFSKECSLSRFSDVLRFEILDEHAKWFIEQKRDSKSIYTIFQSAYTNHQANFQLNTLWFLAVLMGSRQTSGRPMTTLTSSDDHRFKL